MTTDMDLVNKFFKILKKFLNKYLNGHKISINFILCKKRIKKMAFKINTPKGGVKITVAIKINRPHR